METRICSVDGCEKSLYARTLCGMHYQRQRLLGDIGEAAPRFMQNSTVEERFWAKVDKNGPLPLTPFRPVNGPCWLWTAGRFNTGYGLLGTKEGARGAHCVSYEINVGPIPEGLEIDHLCRVRACVNPDHLEAVTPRENLMRGEGAAARASRRTHCIHGHPFSGDNLYIDFKGARGCRICRSRRRRDRYVRLGK